MRWNEVVTEQLSVVQVAKSYIMDILAPLQAQKVNSITVQQIIDQLQDNPDLEGVDIEPDLITSALNGVEEYKVDTDPDTNELSVMINQPSANAPDKKKQAADDKNIHSAAMRSIQKDDSE